MMRVRVVSLSIVVVLLSACGQKEPAVVTTTAPVVDIFKPVATVKQVMLGITVPASNTVFAVAGTAPTDDAGWQAVEMSALAVAESGNLLLMKPRAVDDGEWRKQALALIETGTRAAEAARAKDAEKTGIGGDDMYNVCEGCHAKYMPKPAVP